MRTECTDLCFLRDTECAANGGTEPRDGNFVRCEVRDFERLNRRLKELHNGRTSGGLRVREREGASARAASLQMGVWA